MKKTFNFGKIAFTGAKKINLVTVSVELRTRGGEPTFTINKDGEKIPTGKTTPVYVEFSACGNIWNAKHTDIVCGGQCLDEINGFLAQLNDRQTFAEIYKFWKKYHLNGMHAGTPEQEATVKAYFNETGERYDYGVACAVLKDAGLYEVNFTGDTVGRHYENEPYRYGSGWVIQPIDGADLLRIEHILSA